MFYSQLLLSKKGPLGVVWQAAHLDRKMTRATIAATNIKEAVRCWARAVGAH
jgi:cohesin complex subunit SCC1